MTFYKVSDFSEGVGSSSLYGDVGFFGGFCLLWFFFFSQTLIFSLPDSYPLTEAFTAELSDRWPASTQHIL